jgi:putative endopeptidase
MNNFYRRLAVAAALGAAACVAAQPASAQTATPLSFGSEIGVDPGIRPGDDFFSYANGDWLKNTPIPAGLQRWTARNEIDALTRRQVAGLIDDATTAPAGSVARKVADFRSAFLNEAAIETRGLSPIAPLLDHIGSAKNKEALTRLLGEGMQADVDPLNWGIFSSSSPLGLSVEPGINGEKTYVAFRLQGGLGLPNRES